MIISERSDLPARSFESLLEQSHEGVRKKAREAPEYFAKRTPTDFESDVYEAICEAARPTPFANSIELVSGHKFPDIVANLCYGVEVKATQSGRWRSVGNSVLESTRVESVERVYLFFGQLTTPAVFKWRLYQDCLYDVAVTHSPRYLIDMDLEPGKSIFDRIGVEYDVLRKKENPILPIVDHYRRSAKPGEEPWWMGSADETIPLTVRLWGDLDSESKRHLEIQAMARFPEIFSKSSSVKYKNLAAWLAARHGVVSPSLRDSFSAGGKRAIKVGSKIYDALPQVFDHLNSQLPSVLREVTSLAPAEIAQYWGIKDAAYLSPGKKIQEWANKLVRYAEPHLGDSKVFLYHLLDSALPDEETPACVKEACARYNIR